MKFDPTYRSVRNEGCDIAYWSQGSGPLLLMIPGGGGRGTTYDPIFEYLASRFTVCTLDRRQAGQSTVVGNPRFMNLNQQVRDLIAVIKDLGFSKASIFGNSGGAVISMQFAVTHPEYLDRVVCHEAPTSALLPDCEEIQGRLLANLAKAQSHGSLAAFQDFRAMQKGFEGFPRRVTGNQDDLENFYANEFVCFGLVCPDLRRIVDNRVRIAVAAGSRSADVWYARTTLEQQKILQCNRYILPGNHAGFELEPREFSGKLLTVLEERER